VLPEVDPDRVRTTEIVRVSEKDLVVEILCVSLPLTLGDPVVVAVSVVGAVGVFPSFLVGLAVQDLSDVRLFVTLVVPEPVLVPEGEPDQVAPAEPLREPLPQEESVRDPASAV
jgi:hypothetical protein